MPLFMGTTSPLFMGDLLSFFPIERWRKPIYSLSRTDGRLLREVLISFHQVTFGPHFPLPIRYSSFLLERSKHPDQMPWLHISFGDVGFATKFANEPKSMLIYKGKSKVGEVPLKLGPLFQKNALWKRKEQSIHGLKNTHRDNTSRPFRHNIKNTLMNIKGHAHNHSLTHTLKTVLLYADAYHICMSRGDNAKTWAQGSSPGWIDVIRHHWFLSHLMHLRWLVGDAAAASGPMRSSPEQMGHTNLWLITGHFNAALTHYK